MKAASRVLALCAVVAALSVDSRSALVDRRSALARTLGVLPFALASPRAANAAKDCLLDCLENCNRVAPKNKAYCASNCEGYCVQPDRRDGLSGSVDASGAEVGWLSAYDLPARATGTPRAVPYGEDRPPGLPDVFGINDKLRATVGITGVQGKR